MDLTKKILERENYSVRCAVGIAGAHEQFIDIVPDGIILDNDLSDGNGLDFCYKLREQSNIPIMFLSNTKEDELPALQAGANDFLKKPYDNDIMMARLGIMLNVRTAFTQAKVTDENGEYDADAKSSAQPRQLFMLNPNAGSFKKKRRTPEIRRMYMTLASCAVFMFVATGIYTALNNNIPYVEIDDGQVPLGEFPFKMNENAKPYTGTEKHIAFPLIGNIAIPAETTNVKMLLTNPKDNPCYLDFEIVLADTGESLYSSGMVEPGMCVEEITLSKQLEKGEYDAVMEIRAYAVEDFAVMNSANVEFSLTAY